MTVRQRRYGFRWSTTLALGWSSAMWTGHRRAVPSECSDRAFRLWYEC